MIKNCKNFYLIAISRPFTHGQISLEYRGLHDWSSVLLVGTDLWSYASKYTYIDSTLLVHNPKRLIVLMIDASLSSSCIKPVGFIKLHLLRWKSCNLIFTDLMTYATFALYGCHSTIQPVEDWQSKACKESIFQTRERHISSSDASPSFGHANANLNH